MEGDNDHDSEMTVNPDPVGSRNDHEAVGAPVTHVKLEVPPGPSSTAVDGKGMWRSWTRVFAKPESACLDLLDNCFDAALKPGFHGRVSMQSNPGGATTFTESVIAIQNNSQKPIKRLEDAMTVYKSSKNARDNDDEVDKDKDAIGENGVGLKQGCAALSDCSIVLTRNHSTVEIGIIAKELQSTLGVCLPSFAFNLRDPSELSDIVRRWLQNHPEISSAIGDAFGPSVDVHHQVTQFAESLSQGQWESEDHVFLLVLCKLKKSSDVQHALIQSTNPAKAFLQDIKAMLPEYYINLPTSQGTFDFVIDNETVDFCHWQRRLVELTKFEVYIPTDRTLESLPEDSWDKPTDDKHKLSIYCGFDAQRVNRDLQLRLGSSTCMLYIHSCQAGRLIKKEMDARHMLGLSSSGVDYAQGLTVIVNDVAGKLPLTPTKDGIAWSERTNGDIHQRNLLTWTGAVAGFFWNYHKNRFCGRTVKEVMKNAIRSFALEEQANSTTKKVAETLEGANFTEFQGVQWKRFQANFDNRWKIRKSTQPVAHVTGPDTLFSLTPDGIKRTREGGGRKPKRKQPPTAARGVSQRKQPRLDARVESVRTTGECPWPDVAQSDLERVCKGVLAFLRHKDRENLFEIPVVEALPQIRDDYLKVVKQPMDFRTIEEERMPSYSSVKQLQEDLILTFQNCIRYNGPPSRYGTLALKMLDAMDDAFVSTDIKQVASRVLSFFRDLDERELFEIPVLEQLPGIKNAYLQVVSQPMDFRTIEEEKLEFYTSLEELRKDLALIFNNCIKFNGAMSAYGVIAQGMLNRMDDVFEDATSGKRRRKMKRLNYGYIIEQATSTEKEDEAPRKSNATKKNFPSTALQKQLQTVNNQHRDLEEQLRNVKNQYQELKQRGETREQQLLNRISVLEQQRVEAMMQVEALKKQITDRDVHLCRRALPPVDAGAEVHEMMKRIQELEDAKADSERKNQELSSQLADRDECILQLKRALGPNQSRQFTNILRENRCNILFYSEEEPSTVPPGSIPGNAGSSSIKDVALDRALESTLTVDDTAVPLPLEPRAWEDVLQLPGTNKMSGVEKVRVRQFFENRSNPTPNQLIYKMKIHESRNQDQQTGQLICKDSFYLELDYRNFTTKLTKKTKQY